MKTELSSLAPASFETEMLVVFAINKADKKDKPKPAGVQAMAHSTFFERMRSSSASVHLGLPFAPTMHKACQTLRGSPVGQVVISRNASSRLRVLPNRRRSYIPHITGPRKCGGDQE